MEHGDKPYVFHSFMGMNAGEERQVKKENKLHHPNL